MDLKLSLQFDHQGRTAQTDYDRHIRDLIEQVLFTAPGERVNRPDFGSGLLRLVFEPNSSELATTTQYLVQGALTQWLSDLIEVIEVRVVSEDSKLEITVVYIVLRSGQRQTAQFTR